MSHAVRNKIIISTSLAFIIMAGFGVYILNATLHTEKIIERNPTSYSGLHLALSDAQRSNQEVAKATFLFISLGLVFFSGLTFAGIYTVLPALRRLLWMAQEVSQGNYDVRADFSLDNEFGDIAIAFNKALDKVVANEQALRAEKEDVEDLVRLRTQDLIKETAQFTASINSLPLGFLLIDTDGKVIMSNPVAVSMDSAMIVKGDHAELPATKSAIFETAFHVAKDSQRLRKMQTKDLIHDGRYLRLRGAPVLLDQEHRVILGSAILIEDLTEEKVLERSKDEFFSIASHELRTPLTAIRGNSSMITDFFSSKVDDPQFADMIHDIHESSVRLIEIVNDFLDASRLEQGKMPFQITEFDLSRVLESIVYEMTVVTKEKNIYIDYDKTLKNIMINSDKDRVKQIIYNLVGNALKFTQEGGITLKVESDHMNVHIYVTDTGPGIAPERQSILFHKFQQTNENIFTRDSTRGTGLGLYISKLIADKLHGTIKLVSSEVGQGTTFSLTLPISAPHLEEPTDQEQLVEDPKQELSEVPA